MSFSIAFERQRASRATSHVGAGLSDSVAIALFHGAGRKIEHGENALADYFNSVMIARCFPFMSVSV